MDYVDIWPVSHQSLLFCFKINLGIFWHLFFYGNFGNSLLCFLKIQLQYKWDSIESICWLTWTNWCIFSVTFLIYSYSVFLFINSFSLFNIDLNIENFGEIWLLHECQEWFPPAESIFPVHEEAKRNTRGETFPHYYLLELCWIKCS